MNHYRGLPFFDFHISLKVKLLWSTDPILITIAVTMNSTEVQNPWRKLYAYHKWFMWLTIPSVDLMLYVLYPAVACIKSVEMFQKLSCLPYVFDSVLA